MSGIPVTTNTGMCGFTFLSDRTKSEPETFGITWSVTMAWNGTAAAFKSASALGPVVAIDTWKPASRSTASRMLSCTGLSSMIRTWIGGRTLCRPLLVLLHHFLFRLQPVLVFESQAFAAAALFIQLVGAQPDHLIQSLERIRIRDG